MTTHSELNPTYDFDLTAELLESFSFNSQPARVEPKVNTGPAFVPVSQSELEAANAAFSRMLADYNSDAA